MDASVKDCFWHCSRWAMLSTVHKVMFCVSSFKSEPTSFDGASSWTSLVAKKTGPTSLNACETYETKTCSIYKGPLRVSQRPHFCNSWTTKLPVTVLNPNNSPNRVDALPLLQDRGVGMLNRLEALLVANSSLCWVDGDNLGMFACRGLSCMRLTFMRT